MNSEAEFDEDEGEGDPYETGLCGAFALAMARRFGLTEILVVSNAAREPWSDEIDFEVTHVVCEHPDNGLVCDAKGWQTLSEVAIRFGIDERWKELAVRGPFDPNDFADLIGEETDGPLCLDESVIDQAAEFIEENLTMLAPRIAVGEMRLPVCYKGAVQHVGSLDPQARSATSMEGSALSVSNCPDAWREINRSQGHEWTLRPRAAAAAAPFIEARALTADEVSGVMDWAEQEGLVTKAHAWRAEWFDEEIGETVHSLHVSEAEAAAELEVEGAGPERVDTWAPTEKLKREHFRNGRIDLLEVQDLVLVSYSSAHPVVAGVWWHERLDPAALSAPRGALTADIGRDWEATTAPAGAPAAVVAFHGGSSTFERFEFGEEGFHFGTQAQAEEVGTFTRAYALVFKKLFAFNADLQNWNDVEGVAEHLEAAGLLGRDESQNFPGLQEWLTSKGFDGFSYPNCYEGGGVSYSAFDNAQIHPLGPWVRVADDRGTAAEERASAKAQRMG